MVISNLTLVGNFLEAVEKHPRERRFLVKRNRKYQAVSTETFRRDVVTAALGLQQVGVRRGDKVVILADTCYEWVVSDLAILSLGAIVVPIYPTLPADQVLYIAEDSDSKVLFFSSKAQWEKVKSIKEQMKNVKLFVSLLDPPPSENALSLKGLQEIGKGLSEDDYVDMVSTLDRQDEATIIYTSGTTGIPKGVVLTHANVFANVFVLCEIMDVSERDVCFSFLPLSHILERTVVHGYLRKGSTIAFAESIEKVNQNMIDVKPTVMVSVPRLFERVYSRIMEKALSGSQTKKSLFLWSLSVAEKKLHLEMARKKLPYSLRFKYGLADRLVFKKVKENLGGRFRFFISGGAALPKKIAEFFYEMGLPVLEGYGLTESSPVVAVNTFQDFKVGTVGKPIPGEEVVIAEDGEILVKGPNVMKGYYKKPEETAEAFNKEGWFLTGDIGFIDNEGFLSITDRKKAIIVTLGGKNVAPQPIEGRIKQSPYVGNVVLIGNERKYLSALLVPDFEKMEEIGKILNKSFHGRADFCSDSSVERFYLREIKKMVPDLADFEVIKKVALLEEDFSIEKGEITPTLKVKRSFVEKKYKKVIDRLY